MLTNRVKRGTRISVSLRFVLHCSAYARLQSAPMRCVLLLLVSASALLGGAAHAQVAGDALRACADIGDASERLKCYDAAAHPNPAARQDEFGKPPPPRPGELTQISAGVLELGRTARGRALFVLDNGQTWRQLDGDDSQVHDPAPGRQLRVTIEKGAFDSYNLMVDGRNGLTKVRRVR